MVVALRIEPPQLPVEPSPSSTNTNTCQGNCEIEASCPLMMYGAIGAPPSTKGAASARCWDESARTATQAARAPNVRRGSAFLKRRVELTRRVCLSDAPDE